MTGLSKDIFSIIMALLDFAIRQWDASSAKKATPYVGITRFRTAGSPWVRFYEAYLVGILQGPLERHAFIPEGSLWPPVAGTRFNFTTS
jgi:hypothetical protein